MLLSGVFKLKAFELKSILFEHAYFHRVIKHQNIFILNLELILVYSKNSTKRTGSEFLHREK